MGLAAHHHSTLVAFAARHASLLDAIASVWARAGAGRFAWQDAGGRVLYASGVAAGDALSVPLLGGSLRVEGCPPSLEPMLAVQADLLQEAIQAEAEADLLVDELMRTTDQLVALYEVAAAARAGHDVDDVMRACVEQAVRLTGAERGLLVVRESWRDAAALRVFSFPASDTIESRYAADLLWKVEHHRAPAVANSAQECAALCGSVLENTKRLACAPIAISGRIDAVLCAIDKPIDFTSGDLKLVVALADTAAGFLERARSYERELAQARMRRELEIAAEIQSRLLPRDVPSLPGLQVAAAWQPSRQVGGDLYMVRVVPGNRLALALGDVTGKGVPAALLMAMAHGLLRTGFASTHSPAEAVRQLNAGLADDLSRAGMLLTLFAAMFDPASGQLRAINCGHSPVLVCHRGEVDLWEADGPPIGVLPELLSVERERRLASGDALVALSDGFSEAREPGGNRIGIGPLIDMLRSLAGCSASAIAEALQQRVEEFARGRPRDDDQTLIVLKVA